MSSMASCTLTQTFISNIEWSEILLGAFPMHEYRYCRSYLSSSFVKRTNTVQMIAARQKVINNGGALIWNRNKIVVEWISSSIDNTEFRFKTKIQYCFSVTLKINVYCGAFGDIINILIKIRFVANSPVQISSNINRVIVSMHINQICQMRKESHWVSAIQRIIRR